MSKGMVRTVLDLDRAARALAEHFRTDLVVVVGSQAVLTGWPDAPAPMRTSMEIDAYPANRRAWEAMPRNEGMEASEEIAALFGEMSMFEERHGFYVDGVDERTATLHPDWQKRAVYREIESYGRKVAVVSPSTNDMVVSKIVRLAEKDREWIASLNETRTLDKQEISSLLVGTDIDPSVRRAALVFLMSLPDGPRFEPLILVERLAEFPEETHCAFTSPDGRTCTVRRWDEESRLYRSIDNPVGPAIRDGDGERYVLDGEEMSFDDWSQHPRVVDAMRCEA